MKFSNRGLGLATGVLALGLASYPLRAGAQENLDQGKSAAQLFASDCAICHKTTAGLSKGRITGLEGFLREHYSASRESAAAIAGYINATDKGPPPPATGKPAKRGAKDDKTKGDMKGDEKKPEAGKPSGAKSGDTKPADAKPAEAKPADAKPAASKPAEAKPSESKPGDGQPADIYKPEKKSD
jgi:hypothetical protein